jgi:hypothetical protein
MLARVAKGILARVTEEALARVAEEMLARLCFLRPIRAVQRQRIGNKKRVYIESQVYIGE